MAKTAEEGWLGTIAEMRVAWRLSGLEEDFPEQAAANRLYRTGSHEECILETPVFSWGHFSKGTISHCLCSESGLLFQLDSLGLGRNRAYENPLGNASSSLWQGLGSYTLQLWNIPALLKSRRFCL